MRERQHGENSVKNPIPRFFGIWVQVQHTTHKTSHKKVRDYSRNLNEVGIATKHHNAWLRVAVIRPQGTGEQEAARSQCVYCSGLV
ncbi:MAG: hypothetical protein KTM48_00770 [Wolbachia endosymbiont of Pissodes strobi]|nr:hypothetical protein [Wolbachia endosymbiont of Pissodes strobi]